MEVEDIKLKVRLGMSKAVSGGPSEDERGKEKVQRPGWSIISMQIASAFVWERG